MTHESTTDPEARLYQEGDGQPAKLCYMGHALMENRHGLAVGGGVSQAAGTAERETALALIDGRGRRSRRITLGADKAYDVTRFVHDLRARRLPRTSRSTVTPPRPASGARRRSTDAPLVMPDMRSASVAANGSKRCSAGSRVRGLAKVKLRGRDRVDAAFTLALAAYNLIRLPKLLGAAA